VLTQQIHPPPPLSVVQQVRSVMKRGFDDIKDGSMLERSLEDEARPTNYKFFRVVGWSKEGDWCLL
jgi:hypothetical protein